MAKLRMMDTATEDEETEQQRDSQFVGAASIISTDGRSSPISPPPLSLSNSLHNYSLQKVFTSRNRQFPFHSS